MKNHPLPPRRKIFLILWGAKGDFSLLRGTSKFRHLPKTCHTITHNKLYSILKSFLFSNDQKRNRAAQKINWWNFEIMIHATSVVKKIHFPSSSGNDLLYKDCLVMKKIGNRPITEADTDFFPLSTLGRKLCIRYSS